MEKESTDFGEEKENDTDVHEATADRINDVRIAIVGNVDSGKSTLVGVLTGGQLDDGRGLARKRIFIHNHEQENGRTSCISQHIMGFDASRKPVHQPVPASATSVVKTKSWREVVAKSSSIVTFIDLAGHEKYLKTTIAGLTGCYPDHAGVIINSLAGVTKMTREHLGVLIALEIPFFCVVTKVDMCPENVFKATMTQLFKILKSPAAGKMPMQVRSSADLDTVCANESKRLCPVICVSSVSGKNIDLLCEFLSRLGSRHVWEDCVSKPAEFSIDETFSVTGVGLVFSGTVTAGTISTNDTMLLGPMPDGRFVDVLVRSIQCKRVPVESCAAGDSCAVAVRATKRKDVLRRAMIRRGMVLVAPAVCPNPVAAFDAEVLILHHPTTIKSNYQAVLHAGIIRQTASIEYIDRECLRTGDKALVRFRFLARAEYLVPGTTFLFREGSTKGVGKVKRVYGADELPPSSGASEATTAAPAEELQAAAAAPAADVVVAPRSAAASASQ